jgi:gamma-glutamylcyclotransferase (GGCT)/AIG2-like uncharacterized protein YtfP
MNTPVIHLFVYGSLRRGFQHPVFDYIKNHFTFVSAANAKGKMFDLGDYPAAIPFTEGKGIVGELFVANSEDDFNWAISQLDDYEGLNPEAGEQALYKREATTVTHNGVETLAWIYWYNGDVTGKPVIESGDMLEYFKTKKG